VRDLSKIEIIIQSVRKRLDKKDAAREAAIRLSRQIVRECRGAITSVHKGEDFTKQLKTARKLYVELKKSCLSNSELLYAGYVMDALQELAEAETICSIAIGGDVPAPDTLGIPDEAFVLGLADAIGELRRLFLEKLRSDDTEEAEALLKKMEEFFDALMTFDYPDSLLPTKRKQDVARSVVEKSRGEIVLASQMGLLRKKLKK